MEGESAISKAYHSSQRQRRAVCWNPFPVAEPAAMDTNRDINLHTCDSSGASQDWWPHLIRASQDNLMDALLFPPQERGAAPVIKTVHGPFSSHENNWYRAACIHHPQKHIMLIWECQYVAGV